jgi:hypothetical protein
MLSASRRPVASTPLLRIAAVEIQCPLQVLQGASVVFDVVAVSGRLEMLLELSQPFQGIRRETVQVEVASVARIEC